MQISEAATRSGLSIDTIRYYEKCGILPDVPRGRDGRRRFSAETVEWLTLLYWLRQTGMSMKTMHRFGALYRAGDHTVPARKKILLEHSAHLKQRRADLDRCEDILAHKIAIYESMPKEESS